MVERASASGSLKDNGMLVWFQQHLDPRCLLSDLGRQFWLFLGALKENILLTNLDNKQITITPAIFFGFKTIEDTNLLRLRVNYLLLLSLLMLKYCVMFFKKP